MEGIEQAHYKSCQVLWAFSFGTFKIRLERKMNLMRIEVYFEHTHYDGIILIGICFKVAFSSLVIKFRKKVKMDLMDFQSEPSHVKFKINFNNIKGGSIPLQIAQLTKLCTFIHRCSLCTRLFFSPFPINILTWIHSIQICFISGIFLPFDFREQKKCSNFQDQLLTSNSSAHRIIALSLSRCIFFLIRLIVNGFYAHQSEILFLFNLK